MPTYTVITSNLELDESKKKSIAEGITKIHSKTTGANTYFAQVIFNHNLLIHVYNCEISIIALFNNCLLYTSPSPRDRQKSRMPSSA